MHFLATRSHKKNLRVDTTKKKKKKGKRGESVHQDRTARREHVLQGSGRTKEQMHYRMREERATGGDFRAGDKGDLKKLQKRRDLRHEQWRKRKLQREGEPFHPAQ